MSTVNTTTTESNATPPITINSSTGADTTSVTSTPSPTIENNIYNYVFIGVLAVVLILILYYAYCRFTKNSKVRGKKASDCDDEGDDPVLDFNLRESIKELQNIQNRVVSTLSEQSDI